jgi:transposase-like protein
VAAGKPLTPEERETIIAEYRRTGNYADAGRAAGVDRTTAMRACKAHGEHDRTALHALACARAERKARRYLDGVVDLLQRRLGEMDGATDPTNMARAFSDACRVVIAMNDAVAKREKLRAESEAIARGESAGGVTLVVPQVLVDAPDAAPPVNRPPDE